MDWVLPAGFEAAVMFGVLAMALLFKPWLPLTHRPLQSPWLACVALLPFVWWTEHLLPNGMALHVTGACLLVLMFGWPLAMWTLLPIAMGASYIERPAWPDLDTLATHVVWMGMLPATLALGLGLLIRRWLPAPPLVYILGGALHHGGVGDPQRCPRPGLRTQARHPARRRMDARLLRCSVGRGCQYGDVDRRICGIFADGCSLTDGRYLPGASGKGK